MTGPLERASNAPILVFDGACVLCNGTVRWVLAHEREPRIVFAASQSLSGADILRRSGQDPRDPHTFVLLENDRVLTRSDAALALTEYLRQPWRSLRSLRVVPRALRNAVYDWIARNRFRLFGRAALCLRPDPAQADRFLS